MSVQKQEPIRLIREELYERVWQTPMAKLAPAFGISDVALHKICDKHSIPKPPRGYWAQLQYGKQPLRPPLPPVQDSRLEQILISGQPSSSETASNSPKEEIFVPVRDRLVSLHPLVERTHRVLESIKRRERRVEPGQKADRLNLSVSDRHLRRALLIWDALLCALEGRGWAAAIEGPHWAPKTVLSKEGVRVYIRMVEKSVQVPHLLSAEEQERLKKYPYAHVPAHDVKSTDALVLAIDGQYSAETRRARSDGPKGRLEERLGDFVRVIEEEFQSEQARKLRREEFSRQREEQKRQREEEGRRRLEEETRIKDLEAMAERWHKAQRIRQFLAAIEQRGAVPPDTELGQWLAWGHLHAEAVDPIKP